MRLATQGGCAGSVECDQPAISVKKQTAKTTFFVMETSQRQPLKE